MSFGRDMSRGASSGIEQHSTSAGGLSLNDPSFRGWTRKGRALLCGKTVFEVPLP